MCGIAGLISEKEIVVRKALSAMVAAQQHRGPDDCGEEYLPFGDRCLGLGHRRLSIIDLSCAGHQPMIHPRTGDQIIFNGEIYNFPVLRKELEADGAQFIGHSDTEILLEGMGRYGAAFLKRLRGMYAFAFYNARDKRLLLARDPLGIKPLYLAEANGTTIFASEIRAILATDLVPRKLDMQGVAGLLAYGAVQQPTTIFQHIRAFPAGCYQVIDAHSSGACSRTLPFWSYPSVSRDINQTEAVRAIETTLEDSVRDHLVGDVPVGVFLSSGLDSTVVAALAAKHSPHMRSFTVGFADQPDMSELSMARETAKIFKLEHTEIVINGQDAEDAAAAWLQSLDQPSVDGLNVYAISKAVRAQGITVALSGQGGDELFGGYPSFNDVPQLRTWMRRIGWLPTTARVALCKAAAMQSSEAIRQKMADIARSDPSVLNLFLQRRRAMSSQQLNSLGIDHQSLGLRDNFMPPSALSGIYVEDYDVVWSISQLESRFYQGNMLLRDGDANSMAHSLEVRVPMLDKRMLDLMFAIPGDVRLPNRRADKHLLRITFAPLFRGALLRQGKRGFTFPIARWMNGPLRDLCEHALVNLKSADILRADGIDAIWRSFLNEPESSIWSRAFTLCVLGIYLKRMGVS